MPDVVISLFDFTGIMVKPWLEAGYECWIFDVQHEPGVTREGGLVKVGCDLSESVPMYVAMGGKEIDFVSAFPPCDHLAVSGARWFKGKGLRSLSKAVQLFATAAEYCETSGAPYMIENPVSTIATYWRKPDHIFHPYQYTGLCHDDNYTKKTCLWTGNGFRMPQPCIADLGGGPDDRIHRAAPGEGRKAFRSATPLGFARAVFEANSKERFVAAVQ